jgi:hypothetical protein
MCWSFYNHFPLGRQDLVSSRPPSESIPFEETCKRHAKRMRGQGIMLRGLSRTSLPYNDEHNRYPCHPSPSTIPSKTTALKNKTCKARDSYLGSLPRAGLPHNDKHLVLGHRLQQLFPVGVNGQRSTVCLEGLKLALGCCLASCPLSVSCLLFVQILIRIHDTVSR